MRAPFARSNRDARKVRLLLALGGDVDGDPARLEVFDRAAEDLAADSFDDQVELPFDVRDDLGGPEAS